jgi:hypothetical protein
MKTDFNWKHGIAACALLALAGCGGSNAPIITGDTPGTPGNTGTTGSTGGTGTSGGTGTTATNVVPDSAYASIDAFFAYVQQLVASNSDTAPPVQVGDGAVPPVSDTATAKNF